jgi:hypothetical protein
MENSLRPRTFLTIAPTEMHLGSLGIVIAGPDLSGRSNVREAGQSWAMNDTPDFLEAERKLDGGKM